MVGMDGILLKILQNRSSFSSKEGLVADTILSNPSLLPTCTITEYAERINASPASITRFCKRMGVSGYQEMKLLLARTTSYPDNLNVGSIDFHENNKIGSTADIINSVLMNSILSLNHLNRLLDIENLEKAVSLISASRKILICGIGASGIVAKDLHQKLVRIGIMSRCDDDFDLAKVQATYFDENDLVIAISYSGMKSETKGIVKVAKSKNAKVIAITRAGVNPISSCADVHLQVAPTEAIVRDGATVSRLQMLLVVDILYQMLIENSSHQSVETLLETWRNVSEGN